MVRVMMEQPTWGGLTKDYSPEYKSKMQYVHYHAHCLNLVLVESAKSSIHFVNFFFTIVEKLHMQLLFKHSKPWILASMPLSYRSSQTPDGPAEKQPSGLSEHSRCAVPGRSDQVWTTWSSWRGRCTVLTLHLFFAWRWHLQYSWKQQLLQMLFRGKTWAWQQHTLL